MTRIAFLLVAVLAPALAAQAQPAAIEKPSLQLAKPGGASVAPAQGAATHYWYDGGRRRGLVLDEGLRADFAVGKAIPADQRDVAAKALGAPASGDATGAVVFRDADAPAVKRALPGGVIVTTHAPVDAEAVGRLLAPWGLSVSRRLDPAGTRWLVETPPGVTALELANELHESGGFAKAEPNWGREGELK